MSSTELERFPGNDKKMSQAILQDRRMESILIVDDEKKILSIMEKFLGDYGFKIITALGGKEGLNRFKKAPTELVILDIGMSGTIGSKLYKQIMQVSPHTKVLFVSGNPLEFSEIDTPEINANCFLAKPFSRQELLNQVLFILNKADMRSNFHSGPIQQK